MGGLLRFGVALLALGCAASERALAAEPEAFSTCTSATKLCIGVRSEARPFSYKAILTREMSTDSTVGPLRSAGYAGYMVRVCDAVLVEMMLPNGVSAPLGVKDIGYFDIDRAKAATAEGKATPGDEGVSRFGALGTKYDILCDPATITNDRRDGFITSPPLFLTGVSYISLKGAGAPGGICDVLGKSLIGLVGGTTANREGLRALLEARELPQYRDALLAYLNEQRYENGMPKSPCKNDTHGRIREYSTHTEAATAFCRGDFSYYVGDLEIITENVKMIPGCEYENGTRTYTNDRYAIFGKTVSVDGMPADLGRQLLVAQFFQILGQKTVFNPSVLDKAYSDTFQDAAPSRKLQVLYWSVRGGKLQMQ